MLQVCQKCGINKPVTEFYPNRPNSGTHRKICKACGWDFVRRPRTPEQERQKYLRNRESKLAQVARYKMNNMGKVRLKNKKYREGHRAACNYWTKLHRTAKIQACPSWADKPLIKSIYHGAEYLSRLTGIDLVIIP